MLWRQEILSRNLIRSLVYVPFMLPYCAAKTC